MDAQRTLRRAISCVGIGLHSGNKVQLSLKPAPVNFGIRFRRADLGDHEVPANVQHLAGIQLATALSRNEVSVETVEHLLAALVSMGVDNVLIELNSPEVPIMDGSAAPFVYLIQEAGIKQQVSARKYLKIVRPIALSRGDKRIALVSVGPLQGDLQHQLRSPAAAPPVAHAPDHGRELHRGDRSGAHVHVPEGRREPCGRTASHSAGRSTTPSCSAKRAC